MNKKIIDALWVGAGVFALIGMLTATVGGLVMINELMEHIRAIPLK